MTTKYQIIEIDRSEITVDVSLLQKNDSMFFNATEMARRFGKTPYEWLRKSEAKEYIDALLETENLRNGNYDSLVKTKRGGKYQGTWLHNDLAIVFARWLDVRYAVQMDQQIKQMIQDEHDRQRARLTSKTGYLPLTNAIQAANPDAQWYDYANEAKMLCKIVTGLSPKQLCKAREVDNAQDGLCAAEVLLMSKLRKRDEVYIEDGLRYTERKTRLEVYADRWNSDSLLSQEVA